MVRRNEPFYGSNLSGWWVTPELYVVYSYHQEWPLFVFSAPEGLWLENEDRISVTTSKHRSQTRPHAETRLMGRQHLLDFIEWMKSVQPKREGE